jgi:hypothetical protein
MKTLCALCCLLPLPLYAATNLQPRATFSLEHPKTGPQHVITIDFLDAEGEPAEAVVHLGEGRPIDPESYELRVKSGGGEATVPVTVYPAGVEKGFASTLVFRVEPSHTFSTTNAYRLHVKSGTVFLKQNGETAAWDTNNDLPLDNEHLALDQDFVRPRGLQNKLELLGGTGGGNGSFRYTYRANEVRGRGWLNIEGLLKGDFNFLSDNKDKYFNSVIGEVKLFYPFRWNFPGTDPDKSDATARFSEIDVHMRLESDQTFDNADKVIGTSVGTYIKNPVSKLLSSYYLLNGFTKADEATVSPLLVVGYDYVSELKSEDDPDEIEKLDTHAGNHRFRSAFVWSMPLGRNVDLGFLGIGRPIDADALFELAGLYDFRADKFLDQTRVSLNINPRTGGKLRTVYTLSWERGKAAPTFHDVHALLAGLKVNF